MTNVTGIYSTFDATYLSYLSHATLGAHSSTSCVLTANGYTVKIAGSGLTYTGNHPNGGTITGFSVQGPYDSVPTVWSHFSISAATLWGAVASDNIDTFDNLLYSGPDKFVAKGGGGVFSGYGGNDVFDMRHSTSADYLSGGNGNDTFIYKNNFSAFTQIDGGAGTDTMLLTHGGEANLGYVTNVEVVKLSAGFSYDLTTNSATAIKIDGSSLDGPDHLSVDGTYATGPLHILGGSGKDTFISGSGNDIFIGGAGIDTVSYENASSGVTVNLADTAPQDVGGSDGKDKLISVENIIGSSHSDKLRGNSANNFFDGNGGHDVINGGGGIDTVSFTDAVPNVAGAEGLTFNLLSGNAAGDTLTSIERIIGTDFNDTFIGDAGNNYFDAVENLTTKGLDTADYTHASGPMTFKYVSGSEGKIIATGGGQGTDTLVHFGQQSEILAGNFDDTFFANYDYLPVLDGGGGTNTLSFQHATSGVLVALGSTNSGDILNFQVLKGSPYNDTLTGDSGSNLIYGGAGADRINGGVYASSADGNDTIYGGDGNDTISGGNDVSSHDGDDTLYGGKGNDTLSGGGYAGSHSGNDALYGGLGDDILYGGGRDSQGHDGNNLLDGGPGNDALHGGDGIDTASYQDAKGGGVTVDLSDAGPQNVGGGLGTDTLDSIENLLGSKYADTLTGNGRANELVGGNGNDTLDGGGGNDVLNGGGGADHLIGGNGADKFFYQSVSESTGVKYDTISGFDFGGGDVIDLPFAVSGVDTAIAAGALSKSSFDADLSAAVDAAHMGANHAVLFTPDSGSLAGKTFLIVDANGTAGYQAGQDYVICLDSPLHADQIGAATFV